ncbi:hypothetical protein [Stieleria varia]|nr:hypothetical protein [Stieleria varia]
MPEGSVPAGYSPVGGPQIAVGDHPVDSGALTQDSVDGGSAVGDANASQTAGHGQAPPVSGFHSAPADTASLADSTLAGTGEGQDYSEFGDPLRPDWQSERTQRSRQIAMLVALMASVLITTVFVFVYFVRTWKTETTADATGVVDDGSVDPSPSPINDAPNPPDDATPTDDSHVATDDESMPPGDATDVNTGDAANESDPSAPHDAADAAEPEQMAASPNNSPPANTSAIPNDLFPQSPLDDLLGPSPLKSPLTDDPKDAGPATEMMALPKGLRKDFFDLEMDRPQAPPTEPAPPTLDEVIVDRPAQESLDPMLIASPPSPINVRRALAMRYALSTDGDTMPLMDLVTLISQTTGAPIQLQWVSFDLIGSGISQPITVPKGWKTSEDLLNHIAEQAGAEVTIEDYVIRIGPTQANLDAATNALLDLADLGNDTAAGVDCVNQLIFGKSNQANPDRVLPPETLTQKQLGALAADAMRRIRGVTPRIKDGVFAKWAQPVESAQADWPVLADQRSGPTLLMPITAIDLLHSVAARNNADCFVNWDDGIRRRFSPIQRVMPFMGDDVSAGEALADTLSPFELQVRVVDSDYWWVGSEATYDRLPVVLWTQPLADKDDFVARMRAALASDAASSVATEVNAAIRFDIAVDATTERALMVLPRFMVRQLPKILAKPSDGVAQSK